MIEFSFIYTNIGSPLHADAFKPLVASSLLNGRNKGWQLSIRNGFSAMGHVSALWSSIIFATLKELVNFLIPKKQR